MFETIKCPICSSSNFTKYMELSDRFNSSGKSDLYTLVSCACKFVYLNPRPVEDSIPLFYANTNYNPHNNNSSSIFNFIYKTVQYFAFRWKKRIIHSHFKNGKILDIGGGRGEFCSYMENNGYDTTLFDSNTNALEKSKIEKRTHNSNKLTGTFDVITMWHSLEHIHDLNEIFTNIKMLLSKNGILIIAIPNLGAFEQKIFKEDWIAYDTPRHLYHFTKQSLADLLNGHDYKIVNTHKMLQDTAYNVMLSLKGNFVMKIVKFSVITLATFIVSFFNKQQSSTLLCVCKQK